MERPWLGVRLHGESACRYIGLLGGQLAARLFVAFLLAAGCL